MIGGSSGVNGQEKTLGQDLANTIAREQDYESQLNASRRWGREWHLDWCAFTKGRYNSEMATDQYGELALATLKELWCLVNKQFAKKYGPSPGRGAVLIGLGSLGRKRLHSKSDLDLILIYDAAGVEVSSGENH